jgi:hemoglobin-like flavoprotein
MSPEQKALVQTTWRQVVPVADTASALFYDRLFEIDPQVRNLFKNTDMESQRKKLIKTIDAVVGALNEIEQLVPHIEDLGRRHATYGVTDAHYETVGAALLWTLEKGLGDSWTSDVKAAWAVAYATIADVMRAAAAGMGNDENQNRTVAAA